LLVNEEGATHVPTNAVKALAPTGAGAAFVGSLAYFLALGKPMTDAIARANHIAAVSVQGAGTQSSFPVAADLPGDLFA
jgi:ribokinase